MVDTKSMDDAIAITDSLCKSIIKFLIKLMIRINPAHRQEKASQAPFKQQSIFFIRNTSSYFSTHLIKSPFSRIQSSSDFLFKHLKLSQLSKPLLAGLFISTFKIHTFLHQFNNFFVEQTHLDDFALPRKMFTRAVRTHQDVLFLKTGCIRTNLMCLEVVLGTQLWPQDLHEQNQRNAFSNIFSAYKQMEVELSNQTFESRLTYIKERYLSYVDIKENSTFVIVALHEHLGLSNYIRIIVQAFCNNQASIVIPNLFGEAVDQTNRSQDDEAYLMRLNHEMIAQTIWDVVQEIKKTNKKIVLVGFSLGAAFGLKMLEFLEDTQFSMFFYGFPPQDEIRPELIKSRTIVYVGSKDKIKFLSDKNTHKICKQKYSKKSGLGHGFLNPASQNYDEKTFNECSKHFRQILNKIAKDQQEKKQNQKEISKEVQKNNKGQVKPEEGKGKGKGQDQDKDQQGNCQLI